MKKTKLLFITALLTVFSASALRIGFICFNVPDKVYIMEGERYNFDKYGFFGNMFSITSSADNSGSLSKDGTLTHKSGSYTANINLLNMHVKTVNVNVLEKSLLIPCGTPVGVKMYAEGLEILKSESFINADGYSVNPSSEIPFKKGDVITEVNGKRVKTSQQFSKEISKSKESEVTLKITGAKKTYTATVTPAREYNSRKYRVGLVVRDSIAGIGTLTYFNPSDGSFGALGHGIEDADADIIFPLSSGSVEEAAILSVSMGKKGVPGEMHGMFTGSSSLGQIFANSSCGIFGKIDNADFDLKDAVPPATASEIKKGSAQILCTVNDEGVQKFDVRIEKVMHLGADTSKGMVIKITDSRLLSLTGGIVQGMSGSPIVQNGKLVGAVTHVFVNDPTRGYGIFIENMLAEAEKIN